MAKRKPTEGAALKALARAACPPAMIECGTFIGHWDARVFEDPLADPAVLLHVAASVFLDKVIILMVPRGSPVSRKLKKVADAIVWVDMTDPDRAAAHARAHAELEEVLARLIGGPPQTVTVMDLGRPK